MSSNPSDPINFILTGLNKSITTLTDYSFISIPTTEVIDASASAYLYVHLEIFKRIFLFQTDSYDITDISSTDLLFYTDISYLNQFDRCINPFMADVSDTNIIGNMSDYSNSYERNVAYDMIRSIAKDLFGTHHAVDLIQNEGELFSEMYIKGATNIHNSIIEDISNANNMNAVYDSSKNIMRSLFAQLLENNPSRLVYTPDTSYVIQDTSNIQGFPFAPNDTISFKLTVDPSGILLGSENIIKANPRSYQINIVLLEEVPDSLHFTNIFDTGNINNQKQNVLDYINKYNDSDGIITNIQKINQYQTLSEFTSNFDGRELFYSANGVYNSTNDTTETVTELIG